ncbi:MAG: permease, partial [Leptolyngbya sp. DLM2.Bin15]
DLKNIGLMLSVFKPRTIALMSIAIAQLTFLAALLVNFYAN